MLDLGLSEAEHHATIDLDDLKAVDIPHATCENVGITLEPKESSAKAEAVAAETRAILDEYLANFVASSDKGCVACGRKQGGIFGVFTWGICWGEGSCGHCGYPGCAHHRITRDDEEIAAIDNMILQYHPSVLEHNCPAGPVGLPRE